VKRSKRSLSEPPARACPGNARAGAPNASLSGRYWLQKTKEWAGFVPSSARVGAGTWVAVPGAQWEPATRSYRLWLVPSVVPRAPGWAALTDIDDAAPSAVSASSDSPWVDIEVANTAEKVATQQAAVCSEASPFDWALDELWFEQNFCRINFQYCDGLDPSHRSGNQQKHVEVHYFNQSSCSNASWILTARYATACSIFGCTRRTFNINSSTLAPRTLAHEYWISRKGADGKYNQWTAEITSAQGNFTALSYIGHTN
jgi:hypothetical protein